MKQVTSEQAIRNPSVSVIFILCSVGVSLAIASFAALGENGIGPEMARSEGGGSANTPTASCTPAYTFTAGSGTITSGGTDIGNHGDDITTAVAIPFTVQLYGQSFTQANVSSNGNLQFVSNSDLLENACPLPSATLNYSIMPHWDDLRTDQNTGCTAYQDGTCGIYTQTQGTAPNRTFHIGEGGAL